MLIKLIKKLAEVFENKRLAHKQQHNDKVIAEILNDLEKRAY